MIHVEDQTDLTLTGLSFEFGSHLSKGGCIHVETSTLEAEDVNFIQCSGFGGAVFVSSAAATITRANFIRCSAASGFGGGMFVVNSITSVGETNFISCSAGGDWYPGYGGAVYAQGSTASWSQTSFTSCEVGGKGGALYATACSSFTVEDVSFGGNDAPTGR